jgi:hypothetical protein
LYRKNFEQLEALEKYCSAHIPNMIRTNGDEYLVGKIGDFIRIRIKEERIYLKWGDLKLWLDRMGKRKDDIKEMRAFIDSTATYYSRDQKRDWFRCSHSLKFEIFDENVVYRWLHPDEPEET